ncbi:hypothetical protein AB0M43_23960 [Longispora sp. NPDC051575]|uniref:hypothetical protein n=1 Tax=Longispora sp. NPDC051575 TaxID=3154943 RepID=UPI00341D02D4
MALAAAVGQSAPSEHDLMVQIGTNWWLAWLAPLLLGIYSTLAFRARYRLDTLLALLLMILGQALAHMLASHMIASGPLLVIAVVSIYPVVIWRIEVLGELMMEHGRQNADRERAILTAEAANLDPDRVPDARSLAPAGLPDMRPGAGTPGANVPDRAADPATPHGDVPDRPTTVPEVPDSEPEPQPAIETPGPEPEPAEDTEPDGEPEPEPKPTPGDVAVQVLTLREHRPELTQPEAALLIGISDRHLRTCLREAGVKWGPRGRRTSRRKGDARALQRA